MLKNLKNRLKMGINGVSRENYDLSITIAIIILIGLAGFGLGRLSGLSASREPIKIQGQGVISAIDKNNSQSASVIQATAQIEKGSIVASKNGTKYYLPWCSGVSRISEANKVYFQDEALAQKAGYSKASGCK